MFKTRLLSSIVLVILVLISLIFGSNILFMFTFLLAIIAFFELTKATGVRGSKNQICSLEIVGAIGVIAYYLVIYFAETETYIMLTISLTVIALLFIYVFRFPTYEGKQIMNTVFSFVYAPIMLAYLYLTRNLENGIYIV